jgi:hypothetical protein
VNEANKIIADAYEHSVTSAGHCIPERIEEALLSVLQRHPKQFNALLKSMNLTRPKAWSGDDVIVAMADWIMRHGVPTSA